jgi:hypothetical protein
MTQTIQIGIGGTAKIHCLHDRPKRTITTERQILEIGLSVGQVYDPKQHKLHRCACCENLFIDPSDQPRFCYRCRVSPLVHAPAAPLPEPIGVVA